MGFSDDERGVSVQVGAVILLAFVVIAISAYQVQVVPSQNEEIEYNHNQRLQSQLQEVEATIGSMSSTGDSRTVTVDLATTYPARTLFVNPPRPTGRLETVGTTQPNVSFEVRNATATNPDVDDFWDGTTRNYSTGAIAYRPNYNVYQEAPTTVIANSLVYNEYASTTLVVNQQSVFDGDSISLVALRGSFRRAGGTASVNVRPVSASTTTVPVTATGSDNVTISLVSRLSPDTWRELIDESGEYANQSGHVTAVVDNGTATLPNGEQLYRVEFELERGQTYRLQLSRVGVGELSTTEQSTNASYTVAVTESVTTEEDVNATVTVEVRDQYNNPKSGVEVNATVDGSAGGSIVDTPLTTNEDGRVTFTYETDDDISGTSSKSDTVRVSFSGAPSSGFDAGAPENVSAAVTVQNTDGSGTGGGGGGGGGAYSITFDNAPSYSWNVSDEGSTITLTASTSPALAGVSTDFAVNDSTVASITSEDSQTDSNGDADVTLNAQSNGTVGVYVGSSGSSDVINVTVTNAGGGGGGGNTAPTASFTYSPSTPATGESVSFDASGSSDSDGSITSYEWDFGDGSPNGSGQTTSHSYTSDGSFTVTLTVTDNDGATDTTTRTVSVDNQPPTASFDFTPSNPQTGESVSFDAAASDDPDGSITSYDWDFGDGTTATGSSVSHTYADNGTYTVTLTVTDDDGATNTTTRSVTVQNRVPSVNFSWSCNGASCSFDGSSSSDADGSITSYEWDFGDGSPNGSGQTTSHTYSPPGTYMVTLTVTDDDGRTNSTTKRVTTGGGISFGDTTTWGGYDSVIQQDLTSSRNDDVTIVSVRVNETPGRVAQLEGSGVGFPEIEFYDGSGRTGYADSASGYNLPATMSLASDGSTATFESGTSQTLYLTEFQNSGGQSVDMVGQSVTITITYQVNGYTFQKTVTVTVT